MKIHKRTKSENLAVIVLLFCRIKCNEFYIDEDEIFLSRFSFLLIR